MNINAVYEVEIWRTSSWDAVIEGNLRKVNYDICFLKKALVYRRGLGFVDLNTEETYFLGPKFNRLPFVNANRPMIPLVDLIESNEDNMPKRKILKMYKEHNSKSGENK